MSYSGRCLCGAIRYEVSGRPNAVSICHCADCQRSAGAPMIVWAEFPESELKLTQGAPRTINISGFGDAVLLPGMRQRTVLSE